MSRIIFPDLPGQSITLIRNPVWSTSIKESVAGVETAVGLFPWPRWHYTVQYEVLRMRAATDELAQLAAFLCKCQGQAQTFYYTDPDYNTCSAVQFGTGDGSTTLFQLARIIYDWEEPVWAPNTYVIFKNGTQLTEGTDYTMGTTGQVQFTAAPASGAVLTWTGTYYMPCRLMKDEGPDMERMVWYLWKTGKLEFKSKVYPT